MGSGIAIENSQVLSADKDLVKTHSNVHQDPHVQTTSREEQAEQPTSSATLSARAEDHLFAMTSLHPSNTDSTIKASKLSINLRPSKPEQAGPEGEEPIPQTLGATTTPHMKLSEKAQQLCVIADEVLTYMHEVYKQMTEFETYIQTQKNESKPLYQWAKYSGYRAIGYAISRLDEAASKLEPLLLSRHQVKVYLKGATQFSLSVSKVAVFAMGVMGEKFDTCIDEIEESGLSSEGKENAKVLVTQELKKLLKNCTTATGRVYAALDLLRESLLIDAADQGLDISSINDLILESEGRLRASRKGWLWTVVGLILSTATSAAIGLAAAHLYGPAGFDLALNSNGQNNAMYAQVTHLVERTQAVTNLTGQIHAIKLRNIDNQYKELEAISEAHGQRIDSLVEALGPTNQEGVYYSSMAKPETEVAHSDKTDHEMQRLRHEMEQMRRNVNRMDLRLTKRLDKVDRAG